MAKSVRVVVKEDGKRPSIVKCPAGCSKVVEDLALSVDEAAPLARWAVGVYDPEAGTLTLRPCEGVFCLRPSSKKLPIEKDGAPTEKSYLERAIELNDAFGSVKKQRQLKQRQAGIVDPDNAFGAEGLADILKDLEKNKSASVAGSDDLLPFPVEECDPADMYNYDSVLGLDADLVSALQAQLAALKKFAGASNRVRGPNPVHGPERQFLRRRFLRRRLRRSLRRRQGCP
ncbi:hypothetical protein M885DRAFT_153580 [Pelagophyceae sp. CCMP2097]|nr:hypothetical protein M885DRAFT_153580 [Pelagophyceae sp. CCMP2097]